MDAPPPFPAQDKVMMKPMEEMITNTRTKLGSTPQERKLVVRHEKDHKARILDCPCPRCHSSNTKFCYYNNYSLTQPRYFCKACKRYWTQGGSLRSIPVGGKARKNKRPSSSSSSSSKFKIPNLVESSSNANILTNPNPKFIHHPQDLNLGFTPNLLQLPISTEHFIYSQQTINSSVMAPFLPMVSYQNPVYPVGLSLDGIGSGERILFPFEDLRSPKTATTNATAINANHHQDHSTSDQQITRDDPHQHGDSTSYWTGNIF